MCGKGHRDNLRDVCCKRTVLHKVHQGRQEPHSEPQKAEHNRSRGQCLRLRSKGGSAAEPGEAGGRRCLLLHLRLRLCLRGLRSAGGLALDLNLGRRQLHGGFQKREDVFFSMRYITFFKKLTGFCVITLSHCFSKPLAASPRVYEHIATFSP